VPESALVCFDLGRVLVRICEGWRDAHAHAGLPGVAPDTNEPRVREGLGAVIHAFEVGALTADEFATRSGAVLGTSAASVHRVLDAWLRGTTRGATTLLDDLLTRGHRTACLSNTNARHWELMSRWGADEQLWSRLQLRYASHELGLRKPDPAIYAAVEARSGVAPAQIVFFDDLIENVLAARTRGWRAFEVTSREDPVAEMRAVLREEGLLP
jgi:putative hydrolase of the HAD superfamily